jgi:hypothetical protein
MNIAQIEINLQKLVATINKETFIFDLLLAYGLPKASITRLQKGNLNMSKTEGEISWKKKLFFREEYNSDLHITVSELAKNITHNERFVVVTDYKTFLAIDTKTQDKLDCPITDLAKHYDFFLPWAGMEKAQHANENPADFIARRKPCKDFDKYEQLLKDVQKDLVEGKRKLIDFKQDNLQEKAFYVHNGVLFYLEEINISHKEHYKEDGTRVREDGRTRCIFENGTESNMLKRSVEKILYANGRVVTENIDKVNEGFLESFSSITDADEEAGYIYVLKSKSSDERISSIRNLYKVGYSKIDVEERIKNAEKEPTYLMAPVRIKGAWKCYNMNPQKLEQLLHNFFGNSCLEIDVFDEKGKRHTPREWFIAPFEVIEQAIELIINGKIVKYRYDEVNGVIISK